MKLIGYSMAEKSQGCRTACPGFWETPRFKNQKTKILRQIVETRFIASGLPRIIYRVW